VPSFQLHDITVTLRNGLLHVTVIKAAPRSPSVASNRLACVMVGMLDNACMGWLPRFYSRNVCSYSLEKKPVGIRKISKDGHKHRSKGSAQETSVFVLCVLRHHKSGAGNRVRGPNITTHPVMVLDRFLTLLAEFLFNDTQPRLFLRRRSPPRGGGLTELACFFATSDPIPPSRPPSPSPAGGRGEQAYF